MPVRVLVVDDFEPFRQFLSSTLQESAEFQIVSEVSNGLEAVEHAGRLQPDLILLDISLPGLDGIEAARRIRTLSPRSKILFVSQQSSPPVVREALAAGGAGYVVKAEAGVELLTAVNTLLGGERFLGKRFARHNLIPRATASRHKAQFFPDHACFLDGCAAWVSTALKAGDSVIFVATVSHRQEVNRRLQLGGVNVGAAVREGRYVVLDAFETLATFMIDGMPDRTRFLKVTGDLISAAAKNAKSAHARVAVWGERTAVLLEQGKIEAAIRVEQLWNEIGDAFEVDIMCGFVLTAFERQQEDHFYKKICAEHSSVVHCGATSE